MPAPWASRALPAVPNQYSTSVDGGRHAPIPPAPVAEDQPPALSGPCPRGIPGSPGEHDASARPASDCISGGGTDDGPVSLSPSKDLLTVLPAPPTRPKAFSSRPPARRPLPRPRRPPPPVAFSGLLDLAASIRAKFATSWRCLTEFLCTDSACAGRRSWRRFCELHAPHTARTGMQHACAHMHTCAHTMPQRRLLGTQHASKDNKHQSSSSKACKQRQAPTPRAGRKRPGVSGQRASALCALTMRRQVHVVLLATRGRRQAPAPSQTGGCTPRTKKTAAPLRSKPRYLSHPRLMSLCYAKTQTTRPPR